MNMSTKRIDEGRQEPRIEGPRGECRRNQLGEPRIEGETTPLKGPYPRRNCNCNCTGMYAGRGMGNRRHPR